MREIDQLSWDSAGLLPAVVQDASTGEVLTVAYVSGESLARTRSLGETVFFSRSRNELWHKGETSGNTQKVICVRTDCDQDALLIQVQPKGPACHTGARSCFFESVVGFEESTGPRIGAVLARLDRVIGDRRRDLPEGSYTARLFREGRKRIFQKVGEEAVETVVAGMAGDRGETVRESADLLYHLLVALRELDIPLEEVARELETRGR